MLLHWMAAIRIMSWSLVRRRWGAVPKNPGRSWTGIAMRYVPSPIDSSSPPHVISSKTKALYLRKRHRFMS